MSEKLNRDREKARRGFMYEDVWDGRILLVHRVGRSSFRYSFYRLDNEEFIGESQVSDWGELARKEERERQAADSENSDD